MKTGDKKPGGKITRLEIMLRAWEDLLFVAEMRQKTAVALDIQHEFKFDGFKFAKGHGQNHWRTFRKYLLNSVTASIGGSEFDELKYGMASACNPFVMPFTNNRPDEEQFIDALLLGLFPELIYRWMVSSRRVFSITSDLQTLLAATSLEGIQIRDLKFPFDSFVIELAEPIVGREGNRYDMLLFAQEPDTKTDRDVKCLLISDRVASYEPLPLDLKREMEKNAKRQKWEAVSRKIIRADKTLLTYHKMHSDFMWELKDGERLVLDHVKIEDDSVKSQGRKLLGLEFKTDTPGWDVVAKQQALRILASFCLYLRTLPPVSKHRTEWQRVDVEPLGMPVRAVTDEAEVCMVSTEFTLSPEERIVLNSREVSEELAGSKQKNPHFRRGFWKRPPGQGHNPNAEKSIWVRPTIVNRHLLKEGELPLGAETILLPPKS